MESLKNNCGVCGNGFLVEPDDLSFYAKIGVDVPKMCPPCRARHRLAFRNERNFYKRVCDKCRKDMVAVYSPNKPFPVWCYDCWFADDWDAADYGREYDPSRPFFDQLSELWSEVPKLGLVGVRNADCDYVHISADNKNCYMIVESSSNEDSIHCYWIQVCRTSVDLSFSHNTELSYESDDCYDSYKVLYGKGCSDCRESYFLYDCRNCSNCIGCTNLRNAQYRIFNKQVTKEEYEAYVRDARLDTHSGVEKLRGEFEVFLATQPRKYAEIVNAPNSTGGYMYNVKNNRSVFHSYEAEDCAYSVHVWRGAKECVDCDTSGRGAELNYNALNAGLAASRTIVTQLCWNSTDIQYSLYCLNSNDVFGSVGLRKKSYHILNRPYEKEKYEKLRTEIIAAMRVKGEYGQFFPASLTPFGYNEACGMEQFPLTKEGAAKLGFAWEEHPRGTYGKETKRWQEVPDSIGDFKTDDINKDIFACTACAKNYRIIPAEYQFYRRLSIPLPRLCPDCRHMRRFKARGPNLLFPPEQCGCSVAGHTHGSVRCPNIFQSNYAPGHPEILYCEECYTIEVA